MTGAVGGSRSIGAVGGSLSGGLLGRTPLRVKLLAAVLALVTVALVLISVVSTVALRSYLVGRLDDQLAEIVRTLESRGPPSDAGVLRPVLPSDFLIEWRMPGFTMLGYDLRYELEDLPPRASNLQEATDRAGEPYTVDGINGQIRWRTTVALLQDGTVLTVSASMSDIDSAVSRLIWMEVLIGCGVLALLAAAGVAAVRISLRPLSEIEQTAEAIAAGDLARRVPDPEPSPGPARTEVGKLARALNSMLTQIESAFRAQNVSEAAAQQSAQAAREAEARARQSEERMRQFIADASHELRTPLTTIRGFAELYRQGAASTPEQVSQVVKRIEDEAARMGLLVQDLLLLAQLDRERPLEVAPVELPVVVTDAVQAARAVQPERSISLELADQQVVVSGDDSRLRQVMNNLLTNALVHTPQTAQVTVRVWREDLEQPTTDAVTGEPETQVPAGYGVVEVADRGPGLSPEQAERVFERFYRVDSARTRPAGGGTGLGLAIVAALVAAHHGTVDVDSAPGEGARFRVRLPLASPAPGATADSQHRSRRVEA